MKQFFTFLWGILPLMLTGQNLVKNGSFELYNQCPVGFMEIENCQFITQPTLGTSDFFHTCAAGTPAWVPNNGGGGQNAYNGNGYGGFVTYVMFGTYREYIQLELSQPLTVGTEYTVCMQVSLAGFSMYASNAIGAAFTIGDYNAGNDGLLALPAAYYSPTVITDTTNWTTISFNFTPTQAYDRIIVGSFLQNGSITAPQVPYTPPPSTSGSDVSAYYYIDAISVAVAAQNPQVNILQNDTAICDGQSITLNTENGEIASWSTGVSASTITVSPTVTTTYFITPSECIPISDSITITVVNCDIPNVTINPVDTICAGECFNLQALAIGGTGAFTYTWNNGLTTAQINACASTDTVYWVFVTDAMNQASDTAFIDIVVKPCEPFIPNVFTPSVVDGVNDLFVISGLPASSNLIIYNRWGTAVYQTKDYKNDWDGGAFPDGVYYYILTTPNGKQYKGTVTKL